MSDNADLINDPYKAKENKERLDKSRPCTSQKFYPQIWISKSNWVLMDKDWHSIVLGHSFNHTKVANTHKASNL